ncbi:GNVR domain-containing protein [Geminicoccaceae bacterium 1502E]|nr:GNVR domain-containing protein [Geminicoccaceae bacterium 1502E]
MQQVLDQLLGLLHHVHRRRWSCLLVAWLVGALGTALVVLLPDRYESSARIFADTDGMLSPLMKGITVETDMSRQLDVMQRTLLSRPNLERVVERAGLERRIEGDAHRQRFIEAMSRAVRVSSQGWNLFTVTYRDRDPAAAQAVVAALLEIFVESNVGANRQDMDTARRFVEEQIAVQGAALDEAERRLAEFQKGHVEVLAGERGYFARLQEAREQVIAARADHDAARALRDELQRQLRTVPATIPAVALQGGAFQLQPQGPAAELIALRRRLGELKSRYTERHPDVVATERAIGELEARLAGTGRGAGPAGLPNPVHEQLSVQLAQKEAEIASLASRERKAELVLEELSGLARTMPEAEAELKRLSRDYEVIKRNYEELLTRRQSARIADDLETQTERINFRIVDPPQLPLVPASPPRLLLLAAVLLLAIGAGTGWAVLRGLIEEPFESIRRLQAVYPLRVLGAVSEVVTPAASRRRRVSHLRFGVASAALLLLVLGAVIAEQQQLTAPLRNSVHALLGRPAT